MATARSALRPLPEDVASRIAAGEVIERPASVLKELIENALDSGAARISVTILGAGRNLIRITDDGSGIEPEDCARAFQRHTTSKISCLEDLESLETFGFRGEALFSISAVSKTTLTSTAHGKRQGWRVDMEGGRLVREHEAPPTKGTTLEVRDLFFNTPARAKFLKSDPTERSQLARVVEEAALAHPTVGFSYTCEGRIVADYAGSKLPEKDALRRRVGDVLGQEYGRDLLFAERNARDMRVRAFLSAPENLKSSRSIQYIFVNRRPVNNKTVQQALYRAYEPFRGKNRHPATVLFLDIPSAGLDVNVHPTKREVRFRPDSSVYETVTQTVSRALLEAKGIPTLCEPRRYSEPLRAVPEGTPYTQPMLVADMPADYPKFAPERPVAQERIWFCETLRYLGQIERSYLAFEAEGGLLLVDQHAAQEKILFERYLAEIESGGMPTQKLMLPIQIDLPPSQIEKVLAKKERLCRAGFDVAAYGKTTLNIITTPTIFSKAADVKEMVHGLLDSLLAPGTAAADARYDATATIACKAAVKAHDALGEQEALRLVLDLQECADGTCCPHGRPTMLSLNRGELARRFGRPGPPPRSV